MKGNTKNISSLNQKLPKHIFKLSLKIMATSFPTKDSKLIFKLIFPNKLINLYLIPTICHRMLAMLRISTSFKSKKLGNGRKSFLLLIDLRCKK